MANQVFANGMEIACKSGTGKVIAAFPDVCMTPPENPATPPGVPVPYPNNGLASDTTDGSKNVKISDKEIMLKNKSCFKTSTGDEAGCAAKKGLVSSKNKGKIYFIKWSMDVKVEGENVDRHFDMTTNNHGSPICNEGIPWLYVDSMTIDGHSCEQILAEIHPYDKRECPEGSQSHHIIDNACLVMEGARSMALNNIVSTVSGQQKRNIFQQPDSGHPGEDYNQNKAPCICLEGHATVTGTEHNIAHAHTSRAASRKATSDGKSKFGDLKNDAAESIKQAKGLEDWEAECIKIAIDAYFDDFNDQTELAAPDQDCSATHFDNGSGNMCHASGLINI